jgi:hypothetical protein
MSDEVTLTDRQTELLLVMRSFDLVLGNRRKEYTSQDLMDRGAKGPVNAIGSSLKKLVGKGMVEMTQAPRARGNRKARYRLTPAGRSKAKRFS